MWDFKTYEQVKEYFDKTIKQEGECGFYIETNVGDGDEILYIYRYYGLNKDNPKDPLYVFDTVQLNDITIDTFHCGACSSLFKENGAKYINVISEEDVILKLGGNDKLIQYKRHKVLVKRVLEDVEFEYFSDYGLVEILVGSGVCPTEDYDCIDEDMNCMKCWRKYICKTIK